MVKLNKKGFTLAELLIVVAIIAVLVAVAIPTFAAQLEKSRQGVDESNLRSAYAAARIAEMTGSVNNVPFASNERAMYVGTTLDKITDDEFKYYTSYWYNPDNGNLTLIPKVTVTPAAGADEATKKAAAATGNNQELATEHFKQTSQLGKAQTEKVQVDTSQLPGAGSKLVVYKDAQLKKVTPIASGATPAIPDTPPTPTVTHAGTLDKAIRVTFYHTQAGPFKLHEISFVMYADEPLVNAGAEDTIALSHAQTGSPAADAKIPLTSTSLTADAKGLILVNGVALDTDSYVVKVTSFTDTANLESVTADEDGVITFTVQSEKTPAATSKITVTVISKADAEIHDDIEIDVTYSGS